MQKGVCVGNKQHVNCTFKKWNVVAQDMHTNDMHSAQSSTTKATVSQSYQDRIVHWNEQRISKIKRERKNGERETEDDDDYNQQRKCCMIYMLFQKLEQLSK